MIIDGNKLLEATTVDEFTTMLEDYTLTVSDKDSGAKAIEWITIPENLTKIHNKLMSEFNIPQKALLIRRGKYTRGLRAILLLKAMKVALERSKKNELV